GRAAIEGSSFWPTKAKTGREMGHSRARGLDGIALGDLLTDRLPEVGLRLRRRRRVHVDVAIEVEIQLLEDRHERLDVIVGRLPGGRQREVALEEKLLLREVRDELAVRVRHRG